MIEILYISFLVAAKNASKKAKKDVEAEAEEEEAYTPSTDSGGEDDTSEEEEEVEEIPEAIEKIVDATVKRNEDGSKKRLDDFFIFFSKVFQYMLYYVKIGILNIFNIVINYLFSGLM